MQFNRIGRILVCLVLVCALLIHISPVKARADAVSGTLAITSAAGVTISAPMVVAAALVVLGVGYVTNSDFQRVVNDCVVGLGDFVVDGSISLVQTVDSLGKSTYYVGCDVLEAIRCWLFGSEVVTVDGFVANPNVNVPADALAQAYAAPYAFFSYIETVSGAYAGSMSYVLCYSYESPIVAVVSDSSGNGYTIKCKDGSASGYCYNSGANYWSAFTGTAYGQNTSKRLVGSCFIGTADPLSISTTYDLQLGVLPTVPIDGTSARTWAPEYANRGLYVVPGSGTGGNEGQDGKWFWPLAFGLTAGVLGAMSQAEHWTAETPPEFSEYEEKEEYEVTPAPEFDGYPSIEISPVPDPAPDPDPGNGTDPGGDSAETTWWQRFTQWFLDLRTAINELPNRFDEHFENLNNNIQEAPNKFESWIQGVQSSVDSVAESILGTAEDINAAIQSLPNTFMGHFSVIVDAIVAVPQAILSGLKTLFLSLFSPSAEFMDAKVTALKDKYPFVDTFSSLGVSFKSFFQNIGSKPPIIWIDLGAGSGWFPMGGRVKFLDLSWYSQFKPLMDNISGGFLWLWTGWRLFQSAPGIISGASGMFGQARTEHERSFRRKESEEG